MSRGPGKVERRLREALTDPSNHRWTMSELIEEVFGLTGMGRLDRTEAQRVSVGRALRRVLAGNEEWRSCDPPATSGLPRHAIYLIRDRPAPAGNGKIQIWAYRFTIEKLDWRIATIVRRTRTRCTIEVDDQTILTNSYLRPIGKRQRQSAFEDKWTFVKARSREYDARASAAYKAWRELAKELGGLDEDDDAWALNLLDLGSGYTGKDVERAYRKAMQRHHPDHGGDVAVTRTITMARKALLANIPSA